MLYTSGICVSVVARGDKCNLASAAFVASRKAGMMRQRVGKESYIDREVIQRPKELDTDMNTEIERHEDRHELTLFPFSPLSSLSLSLSLSLSFSLSLPLSTGLVEARSKGDLLAVS